MISLLLISSTPITFRANPLKSPFFHLSSRARTWADILSKGPLAMHASAPKPVKSSSPSAAMAERITMKASFICGMLRTILHSFSPLIFGMIRSIKITSGANAFKTSRADMPSFAVLTSKPSFSSKVDINFCIIRWLSTTSILLFIENFPAFFVRHNLEP